jgi:WD40 repeat protein
MPLLRLRRSPRFRREPTTQIALLPHYSCTSRSFDHESHGTLSRRPPRGAYQTRAYVRPPPVLPRSLLRRLDSHTGAVNVVRYNHGAKYCLSGSSDRSIRLWNPATGKEIKSYNGHGREVLALDMCASPSASHYPRQHSGVVTDHGYCRSHDNAKFASCGGDKLVFVWDVASGQVIRRLQGHFGKINAVAFNKDSQVLASGERLRRVAHFPADPAQLALTQRS